MKRKRPTWRRHHQTSLLFGAPRLVRFLTISGKEFLPSQGTFRPIVPETMELDRPLHLWGINREALVDLALPLVDVNWTQLLGYFLREATS